MTEKLQLSKSDRQKVWWRSTFLQGSWNYERMQNLGWAYSLIPAIKKLYTKKEDQAAALERHMEFFNTHPYVAAPILGVTLALTGNILGPIIFFFAWNAIRMAFLWYTQELGYKAGSEITKDMSGGILQDITKGASILGMFILAVLVERWVSIKFIFNVSSVKLDEKAYIHWDKLPNGFKGIQQAFAQVGQGLSQTPTKVTTFQDNLDSLIPGLMGLLLTFACMWLLKKKVSPILIIIALFVIGVLAHVTGLM